MHGFHVCPNLGAMVIGFVSTMFCPLVDCCVSGWVVVVCDGELPMLGATLSGCMNGASPVRFVLSLVYLCAFQINPVCVVTSEVTNPNDWSVFVCVAGPGIDPTSPAFVRRRASQQGATAGLPKNGLGPPIV